MNNDDLSRLCSPRLIKTLKSGKQFIIIGEHEPYYSHAYTMIRSQEQKQGTWTKECEDMFKIAIDRWMEIQMEIERLKAKTKEYKRDCQTLQDQVRCWNCGRIYTCECDLETHLAVKYANKKPDSRIRKP